MKFVATTILIGGSAVWFAVHLGVFQKHDPFVNRSISGPITIGEEWTEIQPPKPLEPVGDQQEIGLVLRPPFIMPFIEFKGVKLEDGSFVVPEVELTDTDGRIVKLNYFGGHGEKIIGFRANEDQQGKKYKSVRVRSPKPIELDGIYWTGVIQKYRL